MQPIIEICGSLFQNNRAWGAGGAAFLWEYPPDKIIIDRCTIKGTSIISNSTETHGGGLSLDCEPNGTITNQLHLLRESSYVRKEHCEQPWWCAFRWQRLVYEKQRIRRQHGWQSVGEKPIVALQREQATTSFRGLAISLDWVQIRVSSEQPQRTQ